MKRRAEQGEKRSEQVKRKDEQGERRTEKVVVVDEQEKQSLQEVVADVAGEEEWEKVYRVEKGQIDLAVMVHVD